MRVAIMGDVHANAEALAAVLGEAARLGAEDLWFLGDLVGYNPDPEACVAELLPRASCIVRGNHDKACAGLLPTEWFNSTARAAVEWTRQAASAATLDSLRHLPAGPVEAPGGFVLCHGTPFDEDTYMIEPGAVERSLRWMRERGGARACFHGHTHRPFACRARGDRGKVEVLPADEEVRIEKGFVYLLNPGSVGQPRDGNPAASFGILDTELPAFRPCRVAYRVEQTQAKILGAGLPRELAWRLAGGM